MHEIIIIIFDDNLNDIARILVHVNALITFHPGVK